MGGCGQYKEGNERDVDGVSGRALEGDPGPTRPCWVPEPVNYRAMLAGRHAPSPARSTNGKCLTRVYQMRLRDTLSLPASLLSISIQQQQQQRKI